MNNGANTSFQIPMVPAGNGFGYGGGYGYPMPVTPFYGGNGGFGGGFGNGEWGWIILLLLAFNGGWGGFGGGGADGAFPWLLASQNNAADRTAGNIDALSVQNQLSSILTALNNGFSNSEVSACNRAMNQMQTDYNGQIAALNRSFAEQTANQQGFNAVQGQLAQGYADNRLDSCQTRNTIQAEGASSRYEAANNTRDIITNQTSNTQAILDKLCQLELDGVKGQLAQAQRENVSLQNQLNMATMAASQAAQTATFQQGMNAEVDQLYNRLKNCPVNTVPVFGNQPIFTCNGGCNGNNGTIF